MVVICRSCDRGNVYCGSVCSKLARYCSLQASNNRYQSSRKGRLKHAARQKRYREHRLSICKKVTDQTSQKKHFNDLLFRANETKEAIQFSCNFCGRSCSTFLRMDFLGSRKGILTNSLTAWPNGP
jgi:hypothetical protein